MVDYSQARILTIENVEHPIHILGVEGPAMLLCFWSFLGGIVVNPLIAPFFSIGAALIARKFFIEDCKGLPLTYSDFFQHSAVKFSVFNHIFPTLDAICIYKGGYRG